jgi:asparagine synthase (glutamine-hydrolysing)
MCGIFAALQTKLKWDLHTLNAVLDSLKHRGPDGRGAWNDDHIFLGHRRLAIIDLFSGAQPMLSHDERYAITFNGEIYNYLDLRSQLEACGNKFVTASDTEVILEGYRRWGIDFLKHIEGMFAFVLWDRKAKSLIAARDRLGIKPLCWSEDDGNLIFASTLEPFLELPKFLRELDFEALRDVLVYDYIPVPGTILKNVNKLPPAAFLTWSLAHPQVSIQTYWQIPPSMQPTSSVTREHMIGQVEFVLEQAVKRQMISDVPLGAFLSGGIDSSLLVAFMARNSLNPVKTFSISFHNAAYDESKYAQEVATQYGAQHTVLPAEDISGSQMVDILSRLDEPFADPALIPTFALSALTRDHVTVALSGDGGDEVFGGYPKYLRGEDYRKNLLWRLMRPLKWLADAIPMRPRGVGPLYWRTLNVREQLRFAWTHYGDYPVFRKDLSQVLSSSASQKANVRNYFLSWEKQAAPWGTIYDSDLLMRTDLTTYLNDNCLVKTDRMSMLNSLEVRVPYLDELVVNEVVRLPADWKIYNGKLKSLLMPLAEKMLPRSVWDRPKHGFTVPLGQNMGESWLVEVNRLLDWGDAHMPIFNYPYLRRLNSINQKAFNIGRELWTPIVILAWFSRRITKFSI